MAISTSNGWVEASGELYHRIPCCIRARTDDSRIVESGWAILERVNDVFNAHRSDSELGKINVAGPGSWRVSPWLHDCLTIARNVEALSNGAWCATTLPLVRLWRQAMHEGREPTEYAIAAARSVCHRDAWSLHHEQVIIHTPGVAFDLGAIAKGFAVDLVAGHLVKHAIDDFLIQVGGETACHGRSATGHPHRIGIPHPDDPENAWCAVISAPTHGLCGSTSGDYRQGFVVGEHALHHILDPRNGRPTASTLASVTCIFSGLGGNALADGLSTAISVMGQEALAAFATSTGCDGCTLRRDADCGLVQAATTGWAALAA